MRFRSTLPGAPAMVLAVAAFGGLLAAAAPERQGEPGGGPKEAGQATTRPTTNESIKTSVLVAPGAKIEVDTTRLIARRRLSYTVRWPQAGPIRVMHVVAYNGGGYTIEGQGEMGNYEGRQSELTGETDVWRQIKGLGGDPEAFFRDGGIISVTFIAETLVGNDVPGKHASDPTGPPALVGSFVLRVPGAGDEKAKPKTE